MPPIPSVRIHSPVSLPYFLQVVIFAAFTTLAYSQTWTGNAAGSNNFGNATNWNTGVVPNGVTATFGAIPGTGDNTKVVNTTTARSLTGISIIDSGYSFTGSIAYTLAGGGIDAGSGLGSTSMTNNVTFSANQTWSIQSGSSVLLNGATLTLGSSDLTFNGGGILVLNAARSGGGSGAADTVVTGNSTLVFNSSDATNSVTGGNFTVDAGSVLAGTGRIHLNNNNRDLIMNGALSVGDLTLGSPVASSFAVARFGTGTGNDFIFGDNSLLSMDLFSNGVNDELLAGSAGLSTIINANVTLTLSNPTGYSFVNGDSYDLFNFNSLTGTFTTVNLPSLAGGLAWDQTNLYTSGVITVTAVPEPSAAMMGALAVMGMAILARRRSC